MEKIAVIELNTNFIKLVTVEVERNKSFKIYNEIVMPINLLKDFEKDSFIQPSVIKEIISILAVFKRVVDKDEITESICFADEIVVQAKNYNGFFNEIQNSSSFRFSIMPSDEEISNVYTAVVNTFNRPKSLIINVTDFSTQFCLFNRRNVLNTKVIPFGRINLLESVDESPENFYDTMKSAVSELLVDMDWAFSELPEDWDIIGVGDVFRNVGVLNRRAKKYPVDIEHNYVVAKQDFDNIVKAICGVGRNSGAKIKGLSIWDSKYLLSGLAIIDAFFSKSTAKNFAISRTEKIEGMLFKNTLPITIDKPITDTLGYSLQAIVEGMTKVENISQVYDLSMLLFRQIKVIHKLGRPYIRILRIASYLSSCGNAINYRDREKVSFDIIVNSEIYGASHAEIILAAFVSKLRDVDNFSLAEWVKYKDLIVDYDVDAIKKLAIIIKIAESLDITKFSVVKDIDCDILGDSVILKLIVDGDSTLEVKHAMLIGNDFKKQFNKNLEIL